ncbi:hypothetical protein OHA70_25550 [Kribbella sp. NBC_00382]|uniref:hypothetical protein n=1 Tax=Kribbella sp. NBC_00382 TaxID=2975967 RepID=UPI002E1D5009
MASRSGRTVGWGPFLIPGEKRTWKKATKAARELLDAAEDVDKRSAANLTTSQTDSAAIAVETRHDEPEERAMADQAAAELETTLAERRRKVEQEFAARTARAEQHLAAVTYRRAELQREVDHARSEAEHLAQQQLADANRQAVEIVAAAKDKSERIRAESERELAAAIHRRDSINEQLTNVRQMLATLSGSPEIPAQLRRLIEDDKLRAGSKPENVGSNDPAD